MLPVSVSVYVYLYIRLCTPSLSYEAYEITLLSVSLCASTYIFGFLRGMCHVNGNQAISSLEKFLFLCKNLRITERIFIMFHIGE